MEKNFLDDLSFSSSDEDNKSTLGKNKLITNYKLNKTILFFR